MQIVTKRLLELGMDENRAINESQLVLLDLKDLALGDLIYSKVQIQSR